jgi:tricorn protease
MNRRTFAPSLLLILVSSIAAPLLAIDVNDTRLLAEPAISARAVAFAYANDIWVADADGANPRRLTVHPGVESGPRFSPDGSTIAFTGEYEGNTDVYVVPATGGTPRRLTWHPGNDVALGFTPDGRSVLFTSPREVYTSRYTQLFTVPVGGGSVTRLPIPNASKAAISPDAKSIAYVPLSEPFRQWKNYRGGTASRILIFDVATHAVEQIPQPEGRSNDTDPMFIGGRIYFRSDRDGEFNLYAFDPATKRIDQITRHDDFPVLNASAGEGRIIYEQAGYLHLLDTSAGRSTRLRIGVAADLLEARERFVSGAKYVRDAAISPTGARAVFNFRGDIVTLPAEKGDDRNLTASTSSHERSPAWSPDGASIAYFSDAGGEYRLHITSHDGKGTPREVRVEGAGFYEEPKWSPDSKKIAYSDNSRSLYVIDVASGRTAKVSSETMYGPVRTLSYNWSPDSEWLAYTRNTPTYMNRIWLYSVAARESYPVTDGLSDAQSPVFDANGKYLYFLASTDAGPVQDWFSMSNADMRATSSIYMAVLPRGVESPLLPKSDEETVTTPGEKPKSEAKPEAETPKPVKVTVDFEGLGQRIQALPVKPAAYRSLQAGKSGQIFYLRTGESAGRYGEGSGAALQRFDLESKKETTVLDGLDGYSISADGKKVLVRAKDAWSISDLADSIDTSKHRLNVDAISVKIDPRAEWPQIFHEAWRINRDYFYDPGMHGADWDAMRTRYAAFLPHLADREDLNRVIQWMSSELAVGHHRGGGGDTLTETPAIPGGLLGADYRVENGRYRFERVFGGLNWNPQLRAPLTEPGVDVRAGEYLLAVDGRELRHPENLYARFERTAGRTVEITVGPTPDGRGSRTVKVVPIENESQLRNRAWVEGNIRRVTEATNGRVAYVYVPNTSTLGHTYFKRYFFPQSDREAIIVDERHNGGGQVADYYIDILRRPHISNWATRYGADIRTPLAAIHGPKVMLIDETAGSGGDLLPWMFRKLEMGTLIGRPTWGGLVGVLGFPTLLDGGYITAPNLAIWTEEGFVVENVGVPPDIEVEQTPADVIAGRDPQLEKAIEVVMQQLEANPPPKQERPPFPVRVRK